MSTKQKILDALGCALDEISEDRLVDILLDAYKRKEQRIKNLEAENVTERQRLDAEIERCQIARHEMRSNPLYGASGEYFFLGTGWRRLRVQIEGGCRISAFEVVGNVDYVCRQVSQEEYNNK